VTAYRLRCDRFEQKPKRVVLAKNFKDWIGALSDPEVAARFTRLRDCITQGYIVPDHYYRRSTRQDDLLGQEGIKHLHLDGGGGDILLFAVEYDDAVVFLEINSHRHFAGEPPGAVLRSLHANCLREQDRQVQERLADRLAARMRIVRRGIKARKPRRDGP